ncbi:MAG TPA: hypothetical protein VIT65_05160 [Microlunatus sp.]
MGDRHPERVAGQSLPMPDGGAAEAALTTDYNAEMLEQRARHRRLRDRSIFVGQPDDIVAGAFGPGLPEIRGWTETNFDFAGYVTDAAPPTTEDRARLRAAYGYRPHERICLVSVGGSGVGESLLRRVLDAVRRPARSCTCRSATISSRTSTSGRGSSAIAPACASTTPGPAIPTPWRPPCSGCSMPPWCRYRSSPTGRHERRGCSPICSEAG